MPTREAGTNNEAVPDRGSISFGLGGDQRAPGMRRGAFSVDEASAAAMTLSPIAIA